MARTMRRETAMIEPEYVSGHGPRRGFMSHLFRTVLGVLLGLGVAAYVISTPGLLDQARALFDARVVANLPEDYQIFAPWVALVLGVLLLLILRRFILNGVVYAAVIGAFLWVPFGNHIMAAVPQVETSFPALRGELTRIVSTNPTFSQLRNVTEEAMPVATVAPPQTSETAVAQETVATE